VSARTDLSDNIRKRLNTDEVHFFLKKHKVNLKLKKEVGPFIANNRETLHITTKTFNYGFSTRRTMEL
jgi:hypothetical protein